MRSSYLPLVCLQCGYAFAWCSFPGHGGGGGGVKVGNIFPGGPDAYAPGSCSYTFGFQVINLSD